MDNQIITFLVIYSNIFCNNPQNCNPVQQNCKAIKLFIEYSSVKYKSPNLTKDDFVKYFFLTKASKEL